LSQTEQGIEIILIDDHSDTSIGEQLHDRILRSGGKYIRHENNCGLAASRNTAINSASTEWFSFCDDDDQWSIDYAKEMLIKSQLADESIGVILAFNEKDYKACENFFKSYPAISELLEAGITPPVATQMYRTEMLKSVGGYDERVFSGVDHDLWITLASTINPKVAAIYGVDPSVGDSCGCDRITKNETDRRLGIQNSLLIWKPKLEASLGIDFYSYFKRSYMDYLDLTFFIQSIQSKKLLNIIHRLSNLRVVLNFVRFMVHRKRGYCNLFPRYNKNI